MDVLVARQPAIVFGLMGVQVVQDDVHLPARVFGDDAVHEVQELEAPAAPVMAGFDQAGGHLQSGEQGRRAMTFVLVVKPVSALPLGSFNQPWARSNAWMCGFSSTDRTTPFSGGCR